MSDRKKQLEADARLMKKLCDIDYGLDDYEVQFVDDVTKQVERGKPLTEKQRAKAEKILEERG